MNLANPKLALISAAMLLFSAVGCSKSSDDSSTTEATSYGQVAFSCSTLSTIGSESKADEATFEIPEDLIPDGTEFALRIYGDYEAYDKDGVSEGIKTLDLSYATLAEYATSNEGGLPYIPEGTFTAALTYGDSTTQAGEDLPSYYGEKEFTVIARGQVSISVTASLSNSIVSFATTENFDGYYENGAEFTLMTEYGSFYFTQGVDSRLIFLPPSTQLSVSGSAVDFYGKTVTFQEALLPETTKGGYRSTVLVDQSESSSSSFTVSLDSSTQDGGSTDADMNPNNND